MCDRNWTSHSLSCKHINTCMFNCVSLEKKCGKQCSIMHNILFFFNKPVHRHPKYLLNSFWFCQAEQSCFKIRPSVFMPFGFVSCNIILSQSVSFFFFYLKFWLQYVRLVKSNGLYYFRLFILLSFATLLIYSSEVVFGVSKVVVS